MTRLFFSNTANQTVLGSSIVASDTVIPLSIATTGWPASAPFKAVIAPDTVSAEVILVTAASPTSFTAVRGQDGTTASNFTAGTFVEHRWSAAEADEANGHVNANSGVHGISGAVVGTTDSQSLSNKSLASPTISTATAFATGTTPALKTKAAAPGTANIQEWNDAAGVRLSRVGQHGDFLIAPDGTSAIPLTARGASGQVASLIEAQDNTGAALFTVDAKGRLVLKPSDNAAAPVKYVPPNTTTTTFMALRNSADSSDQFVLTSAGEITRAAKAWLAGIASDDAIRFPLDGSKFKVDSNGNLAGVNTVTKVAYASGAGSSSSTTGEIKDQQVGDLSFTAVAGRKYRIKWVGRVQSVSGAAGVDIRIRDGGASSPTNVSTQRVGASGSIQSAGGAGAHQVIAEQTVSGLSAGTHTIAAFVAATTGGAVLVSEASGQLRELVVYDEGTI